MNPLVCAALCLLAAVTESAIVMQKPMSLIFEPKNFPSEAPFEQQWANFKMTHSKYWHML